MARSTTDLMRSGMVSSKAANAVLAATKPGVPAKMAKFEGRRKDEGGRSDRGHLKTNEINSTPDKQAQTAPGVRKPAARLGGRQRQGQPHAAHIDQQQRPAFPSGGNVGGKARAGANTRMKGAVRRTGGLGKGNYYGGPTGRPAEGG
jgi:hypothetical protein